MFRHKIELIMNLPAMKGLATLEGKQKPVSRELAGFGFEVVIEIFLCASVEQKT